MHIDEAQTARLATNIRDKWWRINNLYWITTADGDRIIYRPNVHQKKLWHCHNRIIILKARQLGFTTDGLMQGLDKILFTEYCQAGLVAHKREDAENLFQARLLGAYDDLPDIIQEEKKPTKKEGGTLRLENKSSFRVSTSMRSDTLHFLHVSEFGPMCAKDPAKATELVTGTLNAVSPQ